MERVIEMGSDDCTTLQMCLISLNFILKMIKMVNFVCILPQLKNGGKSKLISIRKL